MEEIQRTIERLKTGAEIYACGGYLAQLDSLHQMDIYISLGFERLGRKNEDIRKIYEVSYENWNQTFYALLLKFLGAPNNSEAFLKLARTVEYRLILQYSHQPKTLEALLIGASGLLNSYDIDDYTHSLEREFAYLSHKHKIERMSAKEWVTKRIYPQNHPVLRMAQAAAFFSQRTFILDSMLRCRNPKDVALLFEVNASDYWTNHFVPAYDSSAQIKRIGHIKSNILGINVVAQLQFAYGCYTGKDFLRDRAITLLENSPAESNSKVSRWTAFGVRPRNAFETQALIQLGDCYCKEKRCEACPIGRRIIKSVKSRL
ncbi:MAG: DUF2851 family protein [Alistipes sp.]|jgi:hypothetical protein|nr:DUF2851 family protein [Alistipes sp.]